MHTRRQVSEKPMEATFVFVVDRICLQLIQVGVQCHAMRIGQTGRKTGAAFLNYYYSTTSCVVVYAGITSNNNASSTTASCSSSVCGHHIQQQCQLY